ncbi:hypothetical protein [Ensifer sp. 4252]|uniref:hypothetical protein n=1 Tax=Ensifer sp. 4252 TaxID=3373915 RepID=UPI003D2181B8
MASTSGTPASKSGSKPAAGKTASPKLNARSGGKQGGTHEQHVKAGEQSHKKSK